MKINYLVLFALLIIIGGTLCYSDADIYGNGEDLVHWWGYSGIILFCIPLIVGLIKLLIVVCYWIQDFIVWIKSKFSK